MLGYIRSIFVLGTLAINPITLSKEVICNSSYILFSYSRDIILFTAIPYCFKGCIIFNLIRIIIGFNQSKILRLRIKFWSSLIPTDQALYLQIILERLLEKKLISIRSIRIIIGFNQSTDRNSSIIHTISTAIFNNDFINIEALRNSIIILNNSINSFLLETMFDLFDNLYLNSNDPVQIERYEHAV